MTRLVRFERDDASDAVIINPAHVRYIEDAPRSKRDRQPMTRLHMEIHSKGSTQALGCSRAGLRGAGDRWRRETGAALSGRNARSG